LPYVHSRRTIAAQRPSNFPTVYPCPHCLAPEMASSQAVVKAHNARIEEQLL
jgi:transcription elongation factor Elf1